LGGPRIGADNRGEPAAFNGVAHEGGEEVAEGRECVNGQREAVLRRAPIRRDGRKPPDAEIQEAIAVHLTERAAHLLVPGAGD
jgi:hypothetical protein